MHVITVKVTMTVTKKVEDVEVLSKQYINLHKFRSVQLYLCTQT